VLVTLTEKLLVPLLVKLTNFVPGGGIWMNTQRPEWNDANNALVGYGVSMVTTYHLRRYLAFLNDLFSRAPASCVMLSVEIADLLDAVTGAVAIFGASNDVRRTGARRKQFLDAVGEAGGRYRATVYEDALAGEQRRMSFAEILRFLRSATSLVDATIESNRRADGLFHSYNLLSAGAVQVDLDPLHLMLEGQVAAIESGILSPESTLELLTALRASPLYRPDQHSYLLYPDRELPIFLDKNVVPRSAVRESALLRKLLADGDRSLIVRDVRGGVHFNGDFRNKSDLAAALDRLEESRYSDLVRQEREQVLGVFEAVFDHRSYTGRSGTFFGYEGLGCIYWHMVSKLLLAVQKTVFRARDMGADAGVVGDLVAAYYDIRAGLGTNKSAAEYGAFPTDPYSHTPGDGGAKQPGMTGQVKEDILCRWGELGVRIVDSRIAIDPILLRCSEFLSEPSTFEYGDLGGERRTIDLEPGSLAFTYCQTPFIYRRALDTAIRVVRSDGVLASNEGNTIDAETSAAILTRSGAVGRVEVDLACQGTSNSSRTGVLGDRGAGRLLLATRLQRAG
jgi:hypothetical protein